MKWFGNPTTLEELKKQYKKLALEHHPDRGGNTKDMQEINSEYDSLFARLKNIRQTAEGKTYTTNQTTENADDFKDIISKLVTFTEATIEICGSWIWVTGCTLPYREELKSMHFRWSKSKVAWYYHKKEYCKTSKRGFTLDEIRDLYGSKPLRTEPQLRLSVI